MQPTPEEINKLISQLTTEDVISFFAEKIKYTACPTCTANHWSFIGGENNILSIIAINKTSGFQIPPATVPVFALGCTNCGYIRTHALGIVAAWKLSKGESLRDI